MRRILLGLGILATSPTALADLKTENLNPETPTGSTGRPNIVLIFTDDQLHNLAADPAHSDLLRHLRQRCDQLAAETGPAH